jgi:hypothetical protein
MSRFCPSDFYEWICVSRHDQGQHTPAGAFGACPICPCFPIPWRTCRHS